jgi:segregation and condensation protein A
MTEAETETTNQTWPDGAAPLTVQPTPNADELIVDVGGFEGPLDLLLELARAHKIDLAEISILALANQYLAFIEKAQKMRLDVAADYLVMAAWLAYLKSRLLIPAPPTTDEGQPQDMAALASNARRS